MDDLRGAAGGEGWDGPGEYDDAPAAPMPRLRGISVGEEAVTGEEQEGKGHGSPEQHGSDDEDLGVVSADIRGIDQDDEDSDDLDRLEDCLEAFAGANGGDDKEDEEPTADETDTPPADQQTYAAMADLIIGKLPTGQRVVDLVGRHLREHWLGQLKHHQHIVEGLLSVQEVKDAIIGWWGVLVATLVENSKLPPSSARAIAYEKTRDDKRFLAQQRFSREPSIVRKAEELGVEGRRVIHLLTCVFGAIDEVVDKTLTRQLDEAHLIKVTYPTRDVDLDVHQRRLVFNIGGWLLSSALSRVKRQPSLGPAFLPFVNSHKVGSGTEFREAYPQFSGLEFVVEERNNPWEGKGLIFPSADFYLFVRALEVGYRSAMLSPALLATYLGDLPSEVKRVVSTAAPVKAAWARCVSLVEDPYLGLDGRKGCTTQCDELFDFISQKWHNCRMFAYTNELTTLKKRLKNRKAEMALRDKLKAGVGGRKSTTAQEKAPKPVIQYTKEQRDRQLELNRIIGSNAWQSLKVDHLREYIRECGGKAPSNLNKAQLQKVLRSLAPRAGIDDNDSLAFIRPAIVVPDNWRG